MDRIQAMRGFRIKATESSRIGGTLRKQTKMAIVNPFLRLLGYDTADLTQCIPEFVCRLRWARTATK